MKHTTAVLLIAFSLAIPGAALRNGSQLRSGDTINQGGTAYVA